MAHGQPRRRVLVFGDDTRAFLAIARSLGRKGIVVHAVPFIKHAPALKSRYVKHVHPISTYDRTPAWITDLKSLLDDNRFDLIIPCCDRSIRCLDAHRKELAGQTMALPGRVVIDTLFDKHRTRELAESVGVPIPKGGQLSQRDDATALIDRYGLPLFVKERCSYTLETLAVRGRVHVIRSKTQLDRLLAKIEDRQNYIVEACVGGSGVGISVLATHGRITCAFQHARLKEPRNGGGSSLRVSEPVGSDLLSCCRRLAEATELDGVSMFEFRVDRQTGDFALLEVNARFWGSLPLPVALGVDFPYFLFRQLVHKKQTNQIEYRAGVRARNLTINAFDVLFRNTNASFRSLKRLIRDIAGLVLHPFLLPFGWEVSDTFQADDLRPAFMELLYLPATVASCLWRNRVVLRLYRPGGSGGAPDLGVEYTRYTGATRK